MRNIKLKVSYKGTGYYGFQSQPGHKTIQSTLEKALSDNLKEDITIIGAGRTDRGVHALGQVVSFKTKSKIPTVKIPRYINYDLPDDVTIVKATEVEDSFHPRYDAKSRHYRYMITNSPSPMGYYNDVSWHVPVPLNIEDMKAASNYLVGIKDFKSMMKKDYKSLNTYRKIYSIDIEKTDDMVVVDIWGSSFLRNQVRIMVGTLAEVGLGKIHKDEVDSILKKKDRLEAGVTAPSKGLVLVEVKY